MEIIEIDDIEFRKDLFEAIGKSDWERRFNNHATDLIYCPRKIFSRKIFPGEDFTEDAYSVRLKWMGGKGVQIGITNALNAQGEIVVGYNPDEPASSGSVDFNHKNMDYELKFSFQDQGRWKLPWATAAIQAFQYMAARNKNEMKIKIIFCKRYFDKGIKRWLIDLKEKTWLLRATPEDNIHRLRSMKIRDDILTISFLTGRWQDLPFSEFEWECNGCLTCGLLEMFTQDGTLAQAHQEYLKLRMEYYERKREEKDIATNTKG